MSPKPRSRLREEQSAGPSESAPDADLPRLLYFGSVPVEASGHGSTLLYRLFERYPRDKLLIVEAPSGSQIERRISDAQYLALNSNLDRLWQNRFGDQVRTLLMPLILARPYLYERPLERIGRAFRAEAVITVVTGHFWEAATRYAAKARLPLHLILHDDWPNDPRLRLLQRFWVQRTMRAYYPQAASRLCVSPYMAEEFFRRYGATGDVLYPSRASDALVFDEPPDALVGPCEPFTVAFFGTLYVEYARALQRLAIALRGVNGRLLAFGPKPYASVDEFLNEPNIAYEGMLSSTELIRRCREHAHALFVPMSYQLHDKHNMEISFPSKLADCTATGLPIIIDGPDYCSAVRWARDNAGASEIVTDGSVDGLKAVVQNLQNPQIRHRLAREAIQRGKEYFAHDRAYATLLRHLCRAQRLPI